MFNQMLQQMIDRIIASVTSASTLSEADNQAAWASLVGHRIAFHVSGFPSVHVQFHQDSITLLSVGDLQLNSGTQTAADTDEIDLSVHTDLSTLRQLIDTGYAPPGKLKMNGDIAIAQQLQHLLKSLEIDWAGIISPTIGDEAAYAVTRHTADTANYLQKLGQRKIESFIEFALYEKEWILSAPEFEAFKHSNQSLSDHAARVEFRVKKIQQRVDDLDQTPA